MAVRPNTRICSLIPQKSGSTTTTQRGSGVKTYASKTTFFVQAANQDLAMVRVRENALTGNTNVIDNNIYFDPNGSVFLDDNLDWQMDPGPMEGTNLPRLA